MKCVSCNRDSKKKDRERNGGRCPSCQHPFVTEPTTDGLTDMQIKSAQDAVSANGSLYFSKDHLKYQVRRKVKKQLRTINVVALVVCLIVAVSLIFALSRVGFFIPITLISGFILIAILAARNKYNKTLGRLDSIINQWILINPHEKLITAARYQANHGHTNTSNLDNISFERVLICDRNETVDFFLSNLFHFHYSCPVLGGNGYPQGIYEDMLRRLKQNPNLKVFLLHDYSPAGYAFVRRVKTDPKWFGGGQRFNIIDLGLNVQQKKLFKSMTLKHIDRNQKVKETAELALFQPAALVAMCGAAINESVPLDLISSAAAANSNDGYG